MRDIQPQGGHDIPVETIRMRYAAGLRNFQTLYRAVVDHWYCFDSSMLPPELIAQRTTPDKPTVWLGVFYGEVTAT